MLIKIFESDDAPCSDVYKAFLDLEDKMHLIPELDQVKKTYLVELVQKRFQLMYGDAHGAAYVLDPRYLGDWMSHTLRKEILSLISQRLMKVQERRGKISWQVNTPSFGPTLSMKEKKKRFASRELAKRNLFCSGGSLMVQIGQCCTTLLSRCFRWQHQSQHQNAIFPLSASSTPNCLAPEKVKKLVYIKTNAIQMEGSSC